MGAATGRHGDQALNAIQQRIQKPTDTTAPHGHVLSVPFPHPLLSVVAVTGRIEAAQGRRRLDHRVDAERPGGVTTQSLVTSRGPTGLQPVFRSRRRFQPVPGSVHAPPARAVSDDKLMKHDVTRQPEQRLRRPRRGCRLRTNKAQPQINTDDSDRSVYDLCFSYQRDVSSQPDRPAGCRTYKTNENPCFCCSIRVHLCPSVARASILGASY